MRLHACIALPLFLSACASVPSAPSTPGAHVLVSAPPQGPGIRLVSAPVEPVRQGLRIGRADLEQARALLSRARDDLEPHQWGLLDRKLTAAERAFEHFSSAAKASGQAAEVVRRTESIARWARPERSPERFPGEMQREKRLAEACGYNFAVGVRSAAQKSILEELDPNLNIVIMDWC